MPTMNLRLPPTTISLLGLIIALMRGKTTGKPWIWCLLVAIKSILMGANYTRKTLFSSTRLSDDAFLMFEKPQITLYSGQNLGRTVIDGSGTASIQFDVELEDKYVIASFGDMLFSSPSYDFQILNVIGAPPYTPPPEETGDNETEIPPDEELTPKEEIIEIDPPEITIINPPNTIISENDIAESTNTSDLPGINDFEKQIPDPSPDTGIEITDYVDIIAIAGLQAVTTVKKFKK